VFQPEVPARAIVRAAREGRAEYWISRTVLELIVGNMLMPRAIARYLARTAFAGQQTQEPISPERPDNLYEPVHRYHRTHGSFDAKASEWAAVVDADRARLAVVAAGTVATIGLGYLIGRAAMARRIRHLTRRVVPHTRRLPPRRAA
jgi:hypothetical protein